MKYIWIVIFTLSALTAFGQKSARVRQLEEQRKKALDEIEMTNQLLKETTQTAQNSLNRLNLLSQQILSRKKVISLLNQEVSEIDNQIAATRREINKLEKELGREPVMEEIAQSAQLSVDEVVMSLESGAEVESLHKIIYQGDGNDISLMDRLQEKENGQDAALNRIFLDEILKKLDARERQLIGMRYFKDMTQTEIAAEMGISQVQVSRMEKRILKELKKQV